MAALQDIMNKEPGGGDTQNYSWRDESSEEVEIKFKNLGTFTKKDVNITFKASSLKVSIKGTVVFDDMLYKAIAKEECSWSIIDSTLIITLMKREEASWSALVAST